MVTDKWMDKEKNIFFSHKENKIVIYSRKTLARLRNTNIAHFLKYAVDLNLHRWVHILISLYLCVYEHRYECVCICLGSESIKGAIGLKEEILREREGKRKEEWSTHDKKTEGELENRGKGDEENTMAYMDGNVIMKSITWYVKSTN